MPQAIIISKRFNPGHISHIEANFKLLEEYGFDVRFTVNDRYRSFSEGKFKTHKASVSDYLNLRFGDFVIVWFPSLSVLINILLVRLLSSASIVYVYHEPYTSFNSYRQAGFSWIDAFRIKVVSCVNTLICWLSHKIILPSTRAFNALPVARSNSHRYTKINLLFADESSPDQIKQTRTFISYIGTIAEDHAFDEFVGLMQACICNQMLVSYRFLIATRSEIPERFSLVIEQCVSSGRLAVQFGRPMTNLEINNFYAQSYVVWNAYKRSMQSGVLPKAYMFGTPVMVSEANQSEYFEDGVHGFLISNQYSIVDFQNAILKMELNWQILSNNCRSFFLLNFDYRALATTFMEFLLSRK